MKTNDKNKTVFDEFTDGKYADSYENPHLDFYSDMALQVIEHTPENGLVLDVGTGPDADNTGSFAADIPGNLKKCPAADFFPSPYNICVLSA